MEFDLKYNMYSSNRYYHTIIELIVSTDNTVIKEDIVRSSDHKIDDELINNLQRILDEMKEHNEAVDNYNQIHKTLNTKDDRYTIK